MRTRIIVLFTVLLTCASCSEDILVWDFFNPSVEFTVTDSSGRDLLDPDNPDNVIGSTVTIMYDGEYYHWENATRATNPLPLGIRYGYSENLKSYILQFGEFAPEDNYRSETFTISWGDGTQDEVAFDLYTTWKKQNPTVHQKVYLNGELQSVESLFLEIVK